MRMTQMELLMEGMLVPNKEIPFVEMFATGGLLTVVAAAPWLLLESVLYGDKYLWLAWLIGATFTTLLVTSKHCFRGQFALLALLKFLFWAQWCGTLLTAFTLRHLHTEIPIFKQP